MHAPDTQTAPAGAPCRVTLVEPLAGFDADTDFTLEPIDEIGVLRSLRSARDPELRFVVTPAEVFFADYHASLLPVLTAPVAEALGGTPQGTVVQLYLLLTVGSSLTDTTANLRAPLAIDATTGRAVQVILDDDAVPLATPLPLAAAQ